MFCGVIGFDGGLKNQINQAKAAVLYPPSGLNTLIIGASGSGKTFLAETMYRFALQKKVLEAGAPFVVFNCADYAENPQLLISQLFGYVKGAFSGAKENKRGLVEEADGGILFLDEVHRLPNEGQELLFYLLDKGEFRCSGRLRAAPGRVKGESDRGAPTAEPGELAAFDFPAQNSHDYLHAVLKGAAH